MQRQTVATGTKVQLYSGVEQTCNNKTNQHVHCQALDACVACLASCWARMHHDHPESTVVHVCARKCLEHTRLCNTQQLAELSLSQQLGTVYIDCRPISISCRLDVTVTVTVRLEPVGYSMQRLCLLLFNRCSDLAC